MISFAKKAEKAEKSTVNSNMIGKNAGTVCPIERFSVHDQRINEPGRTELDE